MPARRRRYDCLSRPPSPRRGLGCGRRPPLQTTRKPPQGLKREASQRIFRAGAKPGPDITAVRLIKIAPRVPDEPGPCGPAAATQHFVGVEPGFGVFLVGIHHETRIRPEGRAGPFPDVSDHLPAAETALAFG